MTPPSLSQRNADTAIPVLVVDDEEIVLVALRDLLRQQGYGVSTATDVIQAMTLLKQQPFAIVITDQQMPTLTGLEFLAHVRQVQPDAMRLLITAVLNVNTVIDAINKAEVFRFILKPWERQDLLDTVRYAAERYQALRGERQRLAEALARNAELERLVAQLQKRPPTKKPSRADPRS